MMQPTRSRRCASPGTVIAAVVLGAALAGIRLAAQPTPLARVSVGSGGEQGTGPSRSGRISGDGRYVAFSSGAPNLVGGDTNGLIDAFVHDRLTGRTVRVSVSSAGVQVPVGTIESAALPELDATGRFVAFVSRGSLAPDDTDTAMDVFVHDRDVDADGLLDEPGQIDSRRVTRRADGSAGTCHGACDTLDDPVLLAMSGNGRHILVRTPRAFVDQDVDRVASLYAFDRETGAAARLADSTGPLVPPSDPAPMIDRSGRFVLGLSNASTASAGPAVVVDRDSDGDGIYDEPGASSSLFIPQPPGIGASGMFPEAISPSGATLAVSRSGGLFAQLWVLHRPTGAYRQIMLPTAKQLRQVFVSADDRRLTLRWMDESFGQHTSIFTLDANADGAFDSEGDIAASQVTLPELAASLRFDETLRYAVAASGAALVAEDTNGLDDIYVFDRLSPAADTFDTDGDGLAEGFETRFGLDPASAAGPDGAAGDPDADGVTNAQEQAAGSHPRGTATRFLAEGATGPFFATRLAIANPGLTTARVLARYQTDTGHTTSSFLTLAPATRQAIEVAAVPTLGGASFSTVVESDVPVVVDRSMTWGGGYGSHAETSAAAPATTWYLAEGATHGAFDLFYLLQNPDPVAAAQVEIRYLRPVGAPIVRSYSVPPARRLTILVDQVPGLEAADVSAVVTALNAVPIIVERAMYASRPGEPFAAGHASAGVTTSALEWFLAEGATGFFDLFVLLANPGATEAEVRLTYLRPSGAPIVRTRTLPPDSRTTVHVAAEDPALASTSVSTIVTSTNGVPVIAERAMWWPSGGAGWYEAHGAFGATQPALRWGFADGENGGPAARQTFLLVANPSAEPASVRVTLLFEDGPSAPLTFAVAAGARLTVPVSVAFPASAGRSFGAVVESLGPSPPSIVAERAIYADFGGTLWASGSDLLGTPLP